MTTPTIPTVSGRVDLAAKVDFLARPDSYPRCRRVEIIETHMAWVFLTERRVYKLKKPVRTSYLDFSTVEARRRTCLREVRLNRRLAPDVYLGVLPLTRDAAGRLRLDRDAAGDASTMLGVGAGVRVVDWLVEMRRLPAERMLDRRLADDAPSDEELGAVGRALARYYRGAPRVRISAQQYLERLEQGLRDNHNHLARARYGLPAKWICDTVDFQRGLLQRRPAMFARRVLEGRIVDGHGDLRPEHVCLERHPTWHTPAPVIIDCIEFNDGLRQLDAASDVAFLALECERLGAVRAGQVILDAYAAGTGDRPPADLVGFYKVQHACTRAKIAAWHLDDAAINDDAAWEEKARRYLALAVAHVRRVSLDP
jgi:uncharacterized protein